MTVVARGNLVTQQVEPSLTGRRVRARVDDRTAAIRLLFARYRAEIDGVDVDRQIGDVAADQVVGKTSFRVPVNLELPEVMSTEKNS